MRAYITATSAISPQPTFEQQDYLQALVAPQGAYLAALEPEYRQYIDPKLSRRMARIIKMSVAAAKQSLEQGKVEQPGAIIVGTGIGCLQDTEKFLAEIVATNEGLVSPTAFIQSTHNTIAGQIALMLGCPNHNFTYVQRGFSFENALEDAFMQLQEGEEQVLLGGADEITHNLYKILHQTNYIGEANDRYPELQRSAQKPALGEGASFFVLSAQPSDNAVACIEAVHTFYQPESESDVQEQISAFLQKQGVAPAELDALMLGYNGYAPEDTHYDAIHTQLFPDTLSLRYKHLCGEYFTAAAFGLHIAAKTLQQQQPFSSTVVTGSSTAPLNKLLFYNRNSHYHTLILLSRCQPLQ